MSTKRKIINFANKEAMKGRKGNRLELMIKVMKQSEGGKKLLI